MTPIDLPAAEAAAREALARAEKLRWEQDPYGTFEEQLSDLANLVLALVEEVRRLREENARLLDAAYEREQADIEASERE